MTIQTLNRSYQRWPCAQESTERAPLDLCNAAQTFPTEEVIVDIELDITEVDDQELLIGYLKNVADTIRTDIMTWNDEMNRHFCIHTLRKQMKSQKIHDT